eukprot:1520834-Pyramimonas_sp.AAC.1
MDFTSVGGPRKGPCGENAFGMSLAENRSNPLQLRHADLERLEALSSFDSATRLPPRPACSVVNPQIHSRARAWSGSS